jgi:hypothetical protein
MARNVGSFSATIGAIRATLAVAEHSEALGPDLGPRAQIRKAGANVLGEVGAGRALERPT